MQFWMNGVDYKYIISGKPFGITPASIPVSFELTILFSAFTSVFGMLALNGLPKFSNPIFTNPKFDRATNDRFFLYVDSTDKYYNRDSVRELLSSVHPTSLDEVMEDNSSVHMPKAIWLGALLLVLAGLIPAAIVLNMRASDSDLPRWHVFFDMDFQPKKKPQQSTTIFADGRAMRPAVPGTISRGQLEEQDPFYLGHDPLKMSLADYRKAVFVSATDQDPVDATKPAEEAKPTDETKAAEEAKPAAQDAAAAPAASAPANPPAVVGDGGTAPKYAWVDKLPIEVTEEHMQIGKTKYETYCSSCHGYSGFGDG